MIKAQLCEKDVLVAISASGYAPYCVGALDYAKEAGAYAISLCCNRGALMSSHADLAIDAVLADSDLTQALNVEAGSPIMRIERLTHDAQGQPLDFEHLYYRGDAFQYRLRIDRQKGEQA